MARNEMYTETYWQNLMAEEAKRTESLHARLQVKNYGEMGRGVVALEDIATVGELVIVGKPIRISPVRTDMSFQSGWNRHVDLDDPAERVNHSCDPNLGLRFNSQTEGYDFYALREIEQGEQLTWCYPTTEYDSIAIPEGKECLCGSANCMHRVSGWEAMPIEMKRKFLQAGYVGPHILALELSRGVLI